MQENEFIAQEQDAGCRLDKYLTAKMETQSRSYIQKLIDEGNVSVNHAVEKSNYKLRQMDRIQITLPEPVALDVRPEAIPLEILYEDADVLLVNKPKGMVVHPAAGHATGTLVNAVLHHCQGQLSTINGVMRPGIVHRIDKDTTGVLVICKNDIAHQSLAKQLQAHSITREYRAIVHGNLPDDNGTIHTMIGRHPSDRKKMSTQTRNGKEAITHYEVLERFGGYTYIRCVLETGRTHQIRVHMASIGHPILGDTVYGPKKPPFPNLEGQTLHAMILGFQHPRTGEYMEFRAELPTYFQQLLVRLAR